MLNTWAKTNHRNDIVHGHDPNDEMCPQLQAKKTNKLYQSLMKQQMASFVLHIINKGKHGPCCQYNIAWVK